MAFAGIPVYYVFSLLGSLLGAFRGLCGYSCILRFESFGKPSGSLPWPLRVSLYTTFLVFWEAFWEPSVAFAGIPVYYVFSLLGSLLGAFRGLCGYSCILRF